MNKTAIKNFSIWARNKLIADVSYKAGLMGITASGIAKPLPQSTGTTEFYDIGTKEPYAISGEAVRQRRQLVELLERKAKESDYATAYKYVLEEVAYTWFNRLIAIRFMEVNDYLPSHIRVLSSDSGKMEPDLVTSPFDAELDFTEAEKNVIHQMKLDNAIDELFQMLFIKQCNALNAILPGLFEKTSDYTELLLGVTVIDQDGVVYHLVHDIPEEDFDVARGGQVEIIGWLYQYYNTEPKNAAFAKTGKITKEEIPAVTQLFTPDWIVRYMVENSLGRIFIDRRKNEGIYADGRNPAEMTWDEIEEKRIANENSIAQEMGWRYYLPEAKQEPEIAAQLEKIQEEYAHLEPQDIKVIDPCMGSGHILVYAFDVLMQIYENAGWTQRDAAKSILENNLYGLDIDDRAYQLSYFAVMMKARQYDRRFFNRSIQPVLYAPHNYSDGVEYGSLIQVDKLEPEPTGQLDLFSGDINTWNFRRLLSQKYHVVVTNPPYMGGGSMSGKLSEYVKKHYPDSKADLFACFIERCRLFTKHNGIQAMITQHAWMFLSSFEKLRTQLRTLDIINMIHLGARGFDEISGEIVQTTSFILRNSQCHNYTSIFCRLTEPSSEKAKEQLFLSGNHRYYAKQNSFTKITGAPLAYWASAKAFDAYSHKNMDALAQPRHGLATSDNDRFLKLWYEVNFTKTSLITRCDFSKKWFPMSKGGPFRKWYGNLEWVINYENDGDEIKQFAISIYKCSTRTIQNTQYYFKRGMTWSALTSGGFSVRLHDCGSIFGSGGYCAFAEESKENYILALLNSKTAAAFVQYVSPTLNFEVGHIKTIPVAIDDTQHDRVDCLVKENIQLSKTDWDAFENSWDFEMHPLVKKGLSRFHRNSEDATIDECFRAWVDECESRFFKLKGNEEELNRIFIDIYGLDGELTPEIEESDVTVRRGDLQRDIKSLLSFAVGCMFGRYSLGSTGLAFAGGEWDDRKYSQFKPDADNIIPLTDEDYLEDDIISRLCDFLKIAFGERTLETNLDYIAAALGGRGNSSREIIRSYFLNSFFDDHCQTYSVAGSGKRPIYWLFDSGKQNGFKALVYLHRYNADTIGNLRVDYLHKMQRVYESEIGRMQDTIDHSSNAREIAAATKRKEKLQKQLKECREYDEKIGHLALSRIELDLDDGVKVNYRKLQTAQDGKFYEVLAKSKDIMAKEK